MATTDELARVWAAERQLEPTPPVLALAARRVAACGRLAEITPLLHVPGIVRVDVREHGAGPLMDEGTAYARIYVASSDPEQLQRIAGRIHREIRDAAWPAGLLVVAEICQATWRDRLRARLAAWRSAR
jgi:hypothetical protein